MSKLEFNIPFQKVASNILFNLCQSVSFNLSSAEINSYLTVYVGPGHVTCITTVLVNVSTLLPLLEVFLLLSVFDFILLINSIVLDVRYSFTKLQCPGIS